MFESGKKAEREKKVKRCLEEGEERWGKHKEEG